MQKYIIKGFSFISKANRDYELCRNTTFLYQYFYKNIDETVEDAIFLNRKKFPKTISVVLFDLVVMLL
jgi:hypothetical protein